MPRTVDEGYRDFVRRLTPSSGETVAATAHRKSIEQCIRANFGLNRFWRTGSFGNGTSISGHSDVDYMASIPREKLKAISSSSLTQLRNALAARFPTTGVRTACPAVVVPFGIDKKETTEITPADCVQLSAGDLIYDIPDCKGGWMKTSPGRAQHLCSRRRPFALEQGEAANQVHQGLEVLSKCPRFVLLSGTPCGKVRVGGIQYCLFDRSGTFFPGFA